MKSLFILVVCALGAMCSPFGVSADVIDTDASFITLNDHLEAVSLVVVSDVVEVSNSTLIANTVIAVSNHLIVRIEEDDCAYTGETDDYRSLELYKPWQYSKEKHLNRQNLKPINKENYRNARDGLTFGKASA